MPLAPGFRLNPRGKIEHRMFDLEDLLHGEAFKHGWKDSPDKVEGGPAAIVREEQRKAETANTTRRDKGTPAHVHGERAASKPQRGNRGPRDAKGRFVRK